MIRIHDPTRGSRPTETYAVVRPGLRARCGSADDAHRADARKLAGHSLGGATTARLLASSAQA